jgi:hypothetical protein
MISQPGGITLDVFTRLQSATPACRMARCLAARCVSCAPNPLTKKRRVGIQIMGATPTPDAVEGSVERRLLVRLALRAGIGSPFARLE